MRILGEKKKHKVLECSKKTWESQQSELMWLDLVLSEYRLEYCRFGYVEISVNFPFFCYKHLNFGIV